MYIHEVYIWSNLIASQKFFNYFPPDDHIELCMRMYDKSEVNRADYYYFVLYIVCLLACLFACSWIHREIELHKCITLASGQLFSIAMRKFNWIHQFFIQFPPQFVTHNYAARLMMIMMLSLSFSRSSYSFNYIFSFHEK